MKILLIYPPKPEIAIGGEDFVIYEPLALEYIASGITGSHDVNILDMRIDKRLKKNLEDFVPDVVGITSFTIHVHQVKKLFREIKEWNPEILTVVGGHHATVCPEDFNTPDVDVIIGGEGVFAFQKLINAFEKEKKKKAVSILTGNNGKIYTAPFDLDIDSLPFPNRELTRQYQHHYFSEWLGPLSTIRTSKGCPFHCKYCATWKITRRRYLKRNIDNIIKELAGIEEKYISFADDESMCDSKRMEKLADAIKEQGIKKTYYLYSRGDVIVKHPRLFEKWREIGLGRIGIGLEFFRDQDLNRVEKNVTVKENEEAVRILKNLDVEIVAFFIVNPEFNREDFRLYAEYCKKLELDITLFFVLTPLPGTDFYEEVKEKMITRNYDLFDFTHVVLPTTLPLEDFFAEYSHLYKNARTKKHIVSFLRKLPMKRLPLYIKKNYRFLQRLGKAHKDYQ